MAIVNNSCIIALIAFIQFYFLKTSNSIPIEEDKVIRLSYSDIINTFASTIVFGSNNQCQLKRINLSKNYTWFTKESYNPNQSSSYQYIKDQLLNFSFTSIIAAESLENIIIDYIQIKSFPFYLIDQSNYFNIRYGSFGLAHSFQDYNFSLVHQLYNLHHITRLAFGFNPRDNEVGSFFIGGLPKKIINNKHKAYCKAKEKDYHWSCLLSKVYVIEKNMNKTIKVSYDNTIDTYFQSSESKIFAPKEFIDKLASTVFQEMLENHRCLYDNSYKLALIYCNENVIDYSLPPIHFVFDNYGYSLNLSDLFSCSYNPCELDIIYSQSYNNTWVFGTSFLKRFMSDFDYENNHITFYSNKEFQYWNHTSSNKSKQILFISNIILLLCSVLFILIVNLKIISK